MEGVAQSRFQSVFSYRILETRLDKAECLLLGRHGALRNVSEDWLRKLYTNNGNNGP